ncbi:MAG: PTS sugar transporter subunit IIB [Coprobacillaceae bacterium]
MKKILLVCNAGMSTSLLVTNMEKYAKSVDLDVEIKAVPLTEAERIMLEWDVVMLGPQVRHTLNNLKSKLDGKVPIEVIEMRDYGMMNGENVLNAALQIINK